MVCSRVCLLSVVGVNDISGVSGVDVILMVLW